MVRRAPTLQLEAERLAGGLPPLLVAAERIAETVAQGVHGRRRVGPGEAFWQFRPYTPGDRPQSIDWRASAKSDAVYVREMEWEAAATVHLWRDPSPSMDWHSSPRLPRKRERADLLLTALASLLLRGGERVALLAPGERPRFGRGALPGIVQALALARATDATLPPPLALPRYGHAVLIGDFLAPLPEIEARLKALARNGVEGQVVLLLDPAEEALPFTGRIRFEGLEDEGDWLVPRSEAIRETYRQRMAEHQDGLVAIARSLGWRFERHLTDQSASHTLLTLYIALAEGRRR